MWVLENIEDVKSDMSVFHRVDDINAIPASVFFPRAERLGAYRGVIERRARIRQQEREARVAPAQQTSPSNSRSTNVPAEVMLAQHQSDGWAERV